MFDKEILKVVDDYTYLGVVFTYRNNFKKAIDRELKSRKL